MEPGKILKLSRVDFIYADLYRKKFTIINTQWRKRMKPSDFLEFISNQESGLIEKVENCIQEASNSSWNDDDLCFVLHNLTTTPWNDE